MPLDAFGHHILPLGPNLNQKQPEEHDHYTLYPQPIFLLFFFLKETKNMKGQKLGTETIKEILDIKKVMNCFVNSFLIKSF